MNLAKLDYIKISIILLFISIVTVLLQLTGIPAIQFTATFFFLLSFFFGMTLGLWALVKGVNSKDSGWWFLLLLMIGNIVILIAFILFGGQLLP